MKNKNLFILTFLLVVTTSHARITFDKLIDDTSRNKTPKISLDLRFPYANLFYFHPDEEKPTTKAGFMGIGIGLNIHVNNKVNIDVFGRAVLDFPIPVPAAYDYFYGEHWFLNTKYVGITNSHIIKKWTIGYGIFVGENKWRYAFLGTKDTTDKRPPITIKKSYTVFGTILTAQFRPKKKFYVGLTYRPSFFRLTNSSLRYEHLISIDFGWTFRLN